MKRSLERIANLVRSVILGLVTLGRVVANDVIHIFRIEAPALGGVVDHVFAVIDANLKIAVPIFIQTHKVQVTVSRIWKLFTDERAVHW